MKSPPDARQSATNDTTTAGTGSEQSTSQIPPQVAEADNSVPGGTGTRTAFSWPVVLSTIWVAGLTLLLLRIGLAWILVTRRVRTATPIDDVGDPAIQTAAPGDLIDELTAQGISVRIADEDRIGSEQRDGRRRIGDRHLRGSHIAELLDLDMLRLHRNRGRRGMVAPVGGFQEEC